MRARKGQAAMEFLMTYGWAILVVLAAIGALAYFGILSPSKFLPSSFTMAGGISAGEYKMATDGTLTLGFINNIGTQITVNNTIVNTSNTGSDVGNCSLSSGTYGTLANGQSVTYVYTCTSGVALDNKLKANVKVIYTKSGESVTHTATGSVTTLVEQ